MTIRMENSMKNIVHDFREENSHQKVFLSHKRKT